MPRIITRDTRIAAGESVVITNPDFYDVNLVNTQERPAFLYEGAGSPLPVFTNTGSVSITGDSIANLIGFGVSRYSGTDPRSAFVNEAGAVFSVTSTAVVTDPFLLQLYGTYGYFAPQQSVAFRNDGLFTVTSQLDAYGLFFVDSGLKFANSGEISVGSTAVAYGIYALNGIALRNDGIIDAHGDEAAIGVYIGQFASAGAPFVNNGSIIASAGPESPFAAIGIYTAISLQMAMRGGGDTYLNNGLIAGDYALYINPGNGLATAQPSVETLDNRGEIHGNIYLAYGGDSVINTGVISGYTDLAEGDDLYDGRFGYHFGVVQGGTGNDRLYGGDSDETLIGDEGRDIILGGGGNDFIDGGRGADALDGGSGFDIVSYQGGGPVVVDLAAGTGAAAQTDALRNFEGVLGSSNADTLKGSSGGDFLEGAGGNDVIDGRDGADTLLGDSGDDTLTGGAGNDDFVFSAGDGADTITDFTQGSDLLRIFGYTAWQALQQQGADTLVSFAAGDTIRLIGIDAASLTAASFVFDPAALSPTPEPQARTVQIVSNDYVTAPGEELRFSNPNDIVVTSQRFANTGLVIEGLSPTPWPVVHNAGTLHVDADAASGRVVGIDIAISDAPPGGTAQVRNIAGGVIEVEARGGARAMGIRGVPDVWNAGTISVKSTGGDAIGIFGDAFKSPVVNAGTLLVTATGAAIGVDKQNVEVTWNSGDVIVSGGAGSIGWRYVGYAHPASVEVHGFVNSGTITVTSVAGDGVGVLFDLGGRGSSIWNSGTITAAFAIRQYSEYSPETPVSKVIYNIGTLDGRVELRIGDDLVVNSGRITGLVDLGAGNDGYDGRGGSQGANVTGNAGNDALYGGSGNDSLAGGDGDDTLAGGGGTDTLTGGAGRDVFDLGAGSGADIVTDFTPGTDVIGARGFAAYQSLAQQGADTLVRFSGSDTLLLQGVTASLLTAADFVFNAPALAATPVIPAAPVAPALPSAPADQAAPAFPVLAGRGGLVVTGLPTADILTGSSGDDRLDGLGGADSMAGLAGNDSYYVDSAGDLVFEATDAGTDTVFASVGHYLHANVENLTLLAGAGSIFGVGNAQSNIIAGNEGDNLLLGGAGDDGISGGDGRDALFGEGGSDYLFGEDGVDYLAGGSGDDFLDGGGQADALYGEGGDDTLDGGIGFFTDILVGGDGNDVLFGNSGLGDYDLLNGGGGDDIYVVDTPADLTFEAPAEGTDTVYADIGGAGYYLYPNVENLVLLGTTPFGVGNNLANHLTGNDIGNFLLGGAGDDTIDGGAGGDVLFGEAGADVFVFQRGTGGDVIGDFQPGVDKIQLTGLGFASFAQLAANLVENGGTSALNLGNGDFIVITGVAMAQLQPTDFVFG